MNMLVLNFFSRNTNFTFDETLGLLIISYFLYLHLELLIIFIFLIL